MVKLTEDEAFEAHRRPIRLPQSHYEAGREGFHAGAEWMRAAIAGQPVSEGLEKSLLVLSELNHRIEKLFSTVGSAALTPTRLIETVAESILSNIDGFHVEQFHICPGYGDTHVWAMKNHVPTTDRRLVERCSSHPERRSREQRG